MLLLLSWVKGTVLVAVLTCEKLPDAAILNGLQRHSSCVLPMINE
jgi:hypothetical protein